MSIILQPSGPHGAKRILVLNPSGINIQVLKVIFASDAVTEVCQLREICKKTRTHDIDDLKLQVNGDMCAVICYRLKDLTTGPQRAILEFVEVLSARGTESKDEKNIFYYAMHSSGLLKKIEDLLRKKAAIEMEGDKILTGVSAQLVRIIFLIMKIDEIDEGIMNICTTTIVRYTQALIQKLKEYSKAQFKYQGEEEEQEEELVTTLEQGTRNIKVLQVIIQWNIQYLSSEVNLQELINPLLHINCSKELKCPKRMYIHAYQGVDEFQGSVYYLLSELSNFDNMRDYLVNEHNALGHISHPLVTVAKGFNLGSSQNEGNEYNEGNTMIRMEYYSRGVVSGILNFLRVILNDPNNINTSASIPGLFHALIILSRYPTDDEDEEDSGDQVSIIRQRSLGCLDQIQWDSIVNIRKQLMIEHKLVHAVSSSLSGSNEENADVIYSALITIQNIFIRLRGEGNPTQPALPDILKEVDEQCEQEGTINEIEEHIFRSKEILDSVSIHTNRAKLQMISTYKHKTNRRR